MVYSIFVFHNSTLLIDPFEIYTHKTSRSVLYFKGNTFLICSVFLRELKNQSTLVEITSFSMTFAKTNVNVNTSHEKLCLMFLVIFSPQPNHGLFCETLNLHSILKSNPFPFALEISFRQVYWFDRFDSVATCACGKTETFMLACVKPVGNNSC